jgi:hypothetical protein
LKKDKEKEKKNENLNPDYANAFVFIHDLGEPSTYRTTLAYYEAFQASEASENQSVRAADSNK